MSTIGTLKIHDPKTRELRGSIRTLGIALSLSFEKLTDKQSENSPDYVVSAIVAGGELIGIGSAWKKIPADPQSLPFLSITLDDPSFAAPLNLAAFQNDGAENTFDVVWNRPRQKVAA